MNTRPFKGSNHLVLMGNSPFLPELLDELGRSGIPEQSALVLFSDLPVSPSRGKTFPAPIHQIQGLAPEAANLSLAAPGTAHALFVATYGEPDADRKAVSIAQTLVRDLKIPPERITVPVANSVTVQKIRETCGAGIKAIPVHTLFARVIAQSSRQRHLSEVYEEIFSWHGNEFYTVPVEGVAGASFARCLRLYSNACAVGIRTGSNLRLNPPMNTVIADGDALLVLATEKNTIRKNDSILPAPDNSGISTITLECGSFESFLFLGWNPVCTAILGELDRYVSQGSHAECISLPERESLVVIPELHTLSAHHRTGNLMDREFLADIPWEHFENIILPGNSTTGDGDTRELRHLLEDVLAERGFTNNITSVHWFPREDPGRDLPEGIVSVSLLLRMAMQELYHHEFTRVVEELTTTQGAEIYLKPAENYVTLDKPADFYTILESARRKNETAIGYVRDRDMFLNPVKSARVQFNHFDKIVVLSDDNC